MKRLTLFLLSILCIYPYIQGGEVKVDTLLVLPVDTLPDTLVLSEKYPDYKFKYDGYEYQNGQTKRHSFRSAINKKDATTKLSADQNDSAKKYLSFTEDSLERIRIIIDHEMEDAINFKFKVVDGTPGRWTDSYDLQLKIIPPSPAELNPIQPSTPALNPTIGPEPEPGKRQKGLKSLLPKIFNNTLSERLIRAVLCFAIFLLFILYVALSCQQKRIVKDMKTESDEMRTLLDGIKSKMNNTQSNTAKDALSDSSKEKLVVPSKEDLLRLVSSSDFVPLITKELETITESDGFHQLISECVTKAMRENNAQNDINVEIHSNNDVQGMAIHTAVYENVVYDAVTNTFSITDQVPYRLFRIIEREGEYFFTLVDDPNVHKELFGVLGIYNQCTEVIQESSNPSTVDVADGGMGQLRREGDIFSVSKPIILVLK